MPNKFKEAGVIYETQDYSLFKRLSGNRAVTAARAKKIRTSIEKNGYIKSPICCNELFEIIDGQGRFEALRQLDMPVHFYIEPGAGIEQCIAMNKYGTTWNMYDYISSYAESGDAGYIRFKQIYDEYGKQVGGLSTVNFAIKCSDMWNDAIKGGRYTCSVQEFKDGKERLEKLIPFMPYVSKVQGNRNYLKFAIIFAMGCDGVSIKKLLSKMEVMCSNITPIVNIPHALREISRIYNYNSKSDKVYLDVDYDKYLRGKYSWYANKWGNKSDKEV